MWTSLALLAGLCLGAFVACLLVVVAGVLLYRRAARHILRGR